MRRIYLCHVCLWLIGCMLVVCCNETIETSEKSQLVVEGSIDAGQFPVVKLTKTVPLSDENVELDDLSQYVERWAKVSISDGDRTEVMVGRYDKAYFPPFIYTCYNMRGEVGKEYTLKVETPDGIVAEAKTTIPPVETIERLEVVPTEVDTLFQIYAHTKCKRRCKLFTQVFGAQTEFYSAELGLIDEGMIADEGTVSVKRGRDNLSKGYTPFFKKGEIVNIKFSTLDDESYAFWRSFEDMAALSRVPLFPALNNLKSNVKGALGYWCGYGSSYYQVKIPSDVH